MCLLRPCHHPHTHGIVTTVVGLFVAAVGLIYGVLMVGVPYPDPTPAQAVAERSSVAISGWMMSSGGGVFLVGVAGMGVVGVARLLWPRS